MQAITPQPRYLIPVPYFSTHCKSHRYFPFKFLKPLLMPEELESTLSSPTSTNVVSPSSTMRISTHLFSSHFLHIIYSVSWEGQS